MDAIKEQIEKLKSILSDLQPRIDEEMKEGSRLRMSHIKEFSHDDGVHSKLLGKPSLRVLVHENGVGDEENIIFYNMDLAAKISKGYENDMGPVSLIVSLHGINLSKNCFTVFKFRLHLWEKDCYLFVFWPGDD